MRKDVEFTEHDVFKQPMSEAEIRELLGDRPASILFSTKSPRYKAMGLDGKQLSDDERIRLMVEEPYLIRRPSFRIGPTLVVGLDTQQLDQALGGKVSPT